MKSERTQHAESTAARERLCDIASEINGYLKQFEADKKINSFRDSKRTFPPYWGAGAVQVGRYVYVTYVSFQGATHLTRPDAERYLEFLRGGGIGKHFRAL